MGIDRAHEVELYGLALFCVGGLHVGKIVQGEALALVEADAAAGELISWWLGFEYDRLFLLSDKCSHRLASIPFRAHLRVDGEVLDVGEVGKLPRGEETDWLFSV